MVEPGLTACMIVRDERENLEELLPVLTAASDDVVVIDTGSTDGTADVARAAGARVFEEPWRDDFSHARNRSLDEVRTSHAIWIDADDRIDTETLETVRAECLRRPATAFLMLLVNESVDPNNVTSSWQLRAFPACPEHRFSGSIHEQIVDSIRATGTAVAKLDATVRHTGYLSPEQVIRKARRNLEMLRRESEGGRCDATLLYHWVKAAHRCGELEEAARIARRIVDDPPPGTTDEIRQTTAVTLGGIEFQRGDRVEATRVLRESVERVPNDPLARFFLGELLRRSGDLAGARRELEAARAAPIRQGNLPLPVLGLRRAIRLELGGVLETLGCPAEAAAVYREALDDRPEDGGVVVRLARALIGAGVPHEAERILDGIPEEGQRAGDVLLLRGTIAFDRGADDEAEAFFARASDLLPRDHAAPLHRGHLALRGGRIDRACEHYRQALRLSDTPDTRLGMAAGDLEAGRTAQALDHLAAIVDACPGRPLPRGTEALSGEALLRIGRPQEALGAFEKHLERHGLDARILARVGDCYTELGAPRAATMGYREALKLVPDLADALSGLERLGSAP